MSVLCLPSIHVAALGFGFFRCSIHYTTQENVKHFIPHHAITCAVRAEKPNDDVVSCILLIYNPATACPVHVHSYRCDSPETAQLLQEQLQVESIKLDKS